MVLGAVPQPYQKPGAYAKMAVLVLLPGAPVATVGIETHVEAVERGEASVVETP